MHANSMKEYIYRGAKRMDYHYVTAIVFLIAFAVVAILKIRHYRHRQELTSLVAWCTSEDSCEFRCNLSLQDHIRNAQLAHVPPEYRIADEAEWALVMEILCEYKQNLIEDFFHDRLWIPKTKYVVRGKDFFMFTLCNQLEYHQRDSAYCGCAMHGEKLQHSTAHSLSDFAVVYHKLYYIAYRSCKASSAINPKGTDYCCDDDIKTILDTKQLKR